MTKEVLQVISNLCLCLTAMSLKLGNIQIKLDNMDV